MHQLIVRATSVRPYFNNVSYKKQFILFFI